LEQSTTCDFDSVLLYDGSSDRSLMIGKYCTAAPETITTFSSSLFVVFESDYSNKDGRFLLSWSFDSRTGQGLTCTTSIRHRSVMRNLLRTHLLACMWLLNKNSLKLELKMLYQHTLHARPPKSPSPGSDRMASSTAAARCLQRAYTIRTQPGGGIDSA